MKRYLGGRCHLKEGEMFAFINKILGEGPAKSGLTMAEQAPASDYDEKFQAFISELGPRMKIGLDWLTATAEQLVSIGADSRDTSCKFSDFGWLRGVTVCARSG